MRTRLRTLRRAAKQTREDSMRQRIVRTRCGCDQRRAVPFGEILQQSERVGTYPEHRDKAFRWTGCWSEGDSNPRCREGLYGRNWARVWRTIRPEKKHPCWRESVRLGFGSVSHHPTSRSSIATQVVNWPSCCSAGTLSSAIRAPTACCAIVTPPVVFSLTDKRENRGRRSRARLWIS